MALPKLEVPKYTTTVPSTGEVIEFRPFLVKEEKILMIAQESTNEKEILNAMKSILSSCTFGKVEPDNCTIYDLEYLFLQLRAKSVGETADLLLKCEKCGKTTPVTINLEDIKVQQPEKLVDDKIQLTDDIGVIMRPITVASTERLGQSKDEVTAALSASIKAIYDADNVYETDDTSEKELSEFIDSLSHSQLLKIQEYIENQPSLRHTIEWTCKHDGHKNKIELKGIQAFF